MSSSQPQRLLITLHGAVQGVGFRPFVYRLALEMSLVGWVNNSPRGVTIEVEGPSEKLACFLERLRSELPPRAFIQGMETAYLDPVGYTAFEIRPSDQTGERTALILPDIATCPDCAKEVRDPANRRYRYPFTNCTNCGPRYSIIRSLPYDRPRTTMALFPMCPACLAEYGNPLDRRFHAQPNACPVCGPHVELWDATGRVLAERDIALIVAGEAIRSGRIVAVKGIGGFLLLADARNDDALAVLRRRKHREEKPMALMVRDLTMARALCEVNAEEARLLESPEAPIVLMRRGDDGLSSLVAPGNPNLGVMLPYSPLHALLLEDLDRPVVATSGNLSDETLCTDESDVLERLGGIADLFLVHNRPIAHPVDDSVVRVIAGRTQILRRARGYAPLPIRLPEPLPPLIAVGAHLKNTVALAVGHDVFLSPHIGDLETAQTFATFRDTLHSLTELSALTPEAVACDRHPDYLSTQFAAGMGLPVRQIQHHLAHVLAGMAENELAGPVLGVAWDGTGLGTDGTIWGGEFILVDGRTARRVGHLRTFPLPGGDAAIRQPWRSALGLLFAAGYELDAVRGIPAFSAIPDADLALIWRMMIQGVNAPMTSSVGRLFDSVAALCGLGDHARYEGQAAMQLEFALDDGGCEEAYSFPLSGGDDGTWVVEWGEVLAEFVPPPIPDLSQSQPPIPDPFPRREKESKREVSARFHNGLVEAIVTMARKVGTERVLLTGGCFQNRYLTERAIHRLREAGFTPYWHQRVPSNDGGIALGQIVGAGMGISFV